MQGNLPQINFGLLLGLVVGCISLGFPSECGLMAAMSDS